ncbi:F-box/kelch-repeat protein [Hibiscus syriacus]|uniref:F-box/kelch-repeat protein n=1 Tax=Hibiscus syriacus TaxID=106335 RepID=A0A6A2XBV3_HIBSY|nr:F-box/kelch-repeat protein [Hibiscus syriacus]
MGAFLSLNNPRAGMSETVDVSRNGACKRQKLSSCDCEENPRLIPSLPDEISYQILARIPRINYLNVRLVSRAWKAAIMSTELFNTRKELGTTEEWLYILTKVEGDKLLWYALDPLSRRWQRLPQMPNVALENESRKGLASLRMWNVVGSGIKIADVIRGWLGRKNALDRMPFCGCAIGAVDGSLYVLGGFSRASALRCVWQYNPVLNSWSEVNSMLSGRAYCKTAILNNRLYAVGGFTKGHGGLTPLQSAEVFDPRSGIWSQIPSMPFSKAQVLPTAFLADLLKPIATGMTSYRGRLFVPQSLYCWPFFVDVGGEVYDPKVNSWVEMPAGMGDGWPATAEQREVPIHNLTDSGSPYLLAGLLGKIHVIAKDANNISILQADVQNHVSSPSASSSSSDSSTGARLESAEPATTSETVLWRVVATRMAGSSELVSCQTLNI